MLLRPLLKRWLSAALIEAHARVMLWTLSGGRCWPDLCQLVQVGYLTFATYLLYTWSTLSINTSASYTDHPLLVLSFLCLFRNLVSIRELVLILGTLLCQVRPVLIHSSSQDDMGGIAVWHSHQGSFLWFHVDGQSFAFPHPSAETNDPSTRVPYGCIPISPPFMYFLASSPPAPKACEPIAAALSRTCNCYLGRHWNCGDNSHCKNSTRKARDWTGSWTLFFTYRLKVFLLIGN